jgi:hypothetical protein
MLIKYRNYIVKTSKNVKAQAIKTRIKYKTIFIVSVRQKTIKKPPMLIIKIMINVKIKVIININVS